MLRNLNKSSGGRRILGVPHVGIIASQIISETASGDNGAGLLYDEALANAGKQLRVKVTSSPASGSLFVYENGSFELIGASDGSYSLGYQWYSDNVLGGSDVATFTVGAVSGIASGGTGTSTGSGSGGDAVGSAVGAANAPGETGTSTGSGTGGEAVGGAVVTFDGSAPGGTGTSAGSGTGGNAAGRGVTADEPITLAEAKDQCRIDDNSEDDILLIYISAAREIAEHELGRKIIGIGGFGDQADIPKAIKQWMLIQIATMYKQRETIVTGQVMAVPNRFVDRMLDPYRVYE